MIASFDTLALPTAPAALRHALRTDRARTLTHLYRQTFPVVRGYVRRHGGSDQDAQDIFQDALLLFYEKTVAGQLVLTVPAPAYLLGVGRNLWRRELQRRARLPLTDWNEALPDQTSAAPPAASAEPADAPLAVLDYVAQLGERCRGMLLAFYYFQQPLEQIATDYQYRSVRSATVQKFKCLERLRNAMKGLRAELFTV